MKSMSKIVESLLSMSDNGFDPAAKAMVKEWGDDPPALQILKTIDFCVHGSLTSDVVIQVLNIILDEKIKEEKTNFNELVKKADWRK